MSNGGMNIFVKTVPSCIMKKNARDTKLRKGGWHIRKNDGGRTSVSS